MEWELIRLIIRNYGVGGVALVASIVAIILLLKNRKVIDTSIVNFKREMASVQVKIDKSIVDFKHEMAINQVKLDGKFKDYVKYTELEHIIEKNIKPLSDQVNILSDLVGKLVKP